MISVIKKRDYSLFNQPKKGTRRALSNVTENGSSLVRRFAWLLTYVNLLNIRHRWSRRTVDFSIFLLAIEKALSTIVGKPFPPQRSGLKSSRKDPWFDNRSCDVVQDRGSEECQKPPHHVHVLCRVADYLRLVLAYQTRDAHSGAEQPRCSTEPIDPRPKPVQATLVANITGWNVHIAPARDEVVDDNDSAQRRHENTVGTKKARAESVWPMKYVSRSLT